MRYEDVVKALEEGKKVRLPHWEKGKYIMLGPEGYCNQDDGFVHYDDLYSDIPFEICEEPA